MSFWYFKQALSFRIKVVSCVVSFKCVLVFFRCYICVYYTVCKNLNPVVTQHLLTHCFSEIILPVLRNSRITPQSGFLWELEISHCWGFLPGFLLVFVFLRYLSHTKCTLVKALWEVKDVLFWKPLSLGVAEIGICAASGDEIWYWSILVDNQTDGLGRNRCSSADSLIFPQKARRIWRGGLAMRRCFCYFTLKELTQRNWSYGQHVGADQGPVYSCAWHAR